MIVGGPSGLVLARRQEVVRVNMAKVIIRSVRMGGERVILIKLFFKSESTSFKARWKYLEYISLQAQSHVDGVVVIAVECDEAVAFKVVAMVLCEAWYVGGD